MKHIVVRGGLLLMISCLLATACRTNRTTEKRNELLLEAPASSTAIQSNQRIIRQRAVTVNRSLLTSLPKPSGQQLVTGPENARQFSITLFNDASYVAVVDYFESPSPGTDAWTGHLANAEGSFSIVVDATDILGEVRVAKKGAFRISSLGGPTLVSEIQPGQIVKKPDSVSKEKAFTSAATPPPAEDPPFVQDILVVYTPTARDDAAKAAGASPGSPKPIEKLIDKCIADTNTAYSVSGVTIRLNLVFKGPIAYTGDVGGIWELKKIWAELVKKGDGKLDDIHSARDTYRADIVVLLVSDLDEAGEAGGMDATNVGLGFENQAFAAIAWDDAYDRSAVFSHEVGHIQGNDHNLDSGETPLSRGVYNYSLGRRYKCANGFSYSTIMAVRQDIPYDMIPYFSNPLAKYPAGAGGCPTGVPETDREPHDEAKTINNTSQIVANFRRRTP